MSRSNGNASSYTSNSGSSYSSHPTRHYSSQGSSSYTPRHSSGTTAEPAPSYQLPKHAYKGNGEFVAIKSGDSLSSIATRHHVKGGWLALWSINHKKISNPDLIMAGAKIEL